MTPHGFRAMARTILDEVLGFRPDFIEHQLAQRSTDGANHGKKSRKSNQGCTICHSCRQTRSDSNVMKWRGNRVKWREPEP